jgi:predicted AAA+ superfamily ATPase
MMAFKRNIIKELELWTKSEYRKPLVLRGARQVGKTTAIKKFGESFDNFIHLNLEIDSDRSLFENDLDMNDLMQKIYLEKKRKREGRTLLFIDEIQNSPRAVELMRYFYELMPELFVISAGSLLEIMMDAHKISFPVGRVEYRYMYPLSFEEFLSAINEEEVLEVFNTVPFPHWAIDKLMTLFHRYTLIGGMPEVVSRYIDLQDISSLKPVYHGLITAYIDDVSKYAKNPTEVTIIRHIIESAPFEAGKRITFEKFGHSHYRSREVGDALRTLERAMLLYLRYPTTHTTPPLIPDLKKKPKLQFVDTGLLNYSAGLQAQYFEYSDLHSFYSGILAEHIVASELMSADITALKKPLFWVKEARQSNAEIDFLIQYKHLVIPVEVKAGKTGTLRSLHSYIDQSKAKIAVRLYSGKLEVTETATPNGTPYKLLNLPYFLASKIPQYLEWMEKRLLRQ